MHLVRYWWRCHFFGSREADSDLGELTGYFLTTMDNYKEALNQRYRPFTYTNDTQVHNIDITALDMAMNYSKLDVEAEI